MKISVSVCGRFHAFNLAQQLLKKDLLCQLTTSYPKFEVAKYGIPKYLVNSIFVKEILERSWSNLPVFIRKLFKPHYFILQTYDLLAFFQ